MLCLFFSGYDDSRVGFIFIKVKIMGVMDLWIEIRMSQYFFFNQWDFWDTL